MTKSTKRVFAMLLTLTLLLLPAGAVATATSLFPDIGDEIVSSNFNELSVRNAVSTYFDQREAYLLGATETIENVNPGIVPDEAAHREAIESSNIDWIGSDIIINSVTCWDTYADVIVTETLLFYQDNAYLTESIVHTMLLGQQDDGSIWVGFDGYFEYTTGFRSCSYVPSDIAMQDAASIMTTVPEGGAACLIAVALGEVGYVEEGNNVNKYGDTSGGGWCAAFIVWCANQVEIMPATIPRIYHPPTMRSFYINDDRYYARSSGYVPQIGDIFFGSVGGTQVEHVGIVYSVDSEYIYTIEGNCTEMVKTRAIERNNTYILGYGHPDYYSTNHNYNSYEYLNANYHNVYCGYCDTFGFKSTHSISNDSWYSDGSRHWNQCACGKKGTLYVHIFEYDSTIDKEICIICGRTETVI